MIKLSVNRKTPVRICSSFFSFLQSHLMLKAGLAGFSSQVSTKPAALKPTESGTKSLLACACVSKPVESLPPQNGWITIFCRIPLRLPPRGTSPLAVCRNPCRTTANPHPHPEKKTEKRISVVTRPRSRVSYARRKIFTVVSISLLFCCSRLLASLPDCPNFPHPTHLSRSIHYWLFAYYSSQEATTQASHHYISKAAAVIHSSATWREV